MKVSEDGPYSSCPRVVAGACQNGNFVSTYFIMSLSNNCVAFNSTIVLWPMQDFIQHNQRESMDKVIPHCFVHVDLTKFRLILLYICI